jgi:hypothetical protein
VRERVGEILRLGAHAAVVVLRDGAALLELVEQEPAACRKLVAILVLAQELKRLAL